MAESQNPYGDSPSPEQGQEGLPPDPFERVLFIQVPVSFPVFVLSVALGYTLAEIFREARHGRTRN